MNNQNYLQRCGALLSAILVASALLTNAHAVEVNSALNKQHELTESTKLSSAKYNLDPKDVIFIFADLHPDLIATSNTMSPDALAKNAGGLAKVAHAISAPSLFLTVPRNGKPGELIKELKPYANNENTIYRLNADPFQVNEIVDAIKKTNRKTIIVSGYTAEVAVTLTALGGLRDGYNIYIPVDCIGNRSLRTEQAALARAEQAGAVVTSLASVAAQLAPDFSKEPGTTILSVILDAQL
ncbi:isochorismatase family protein [Pectobacterium versatile]|uniref:isochorismatase family protein n=1 Tax=Pectobacterium versatile TaxID=2488639 RepID=UPI001CCD5853|nr:isochorismatase family protein [Pectobacterium versatile]